MPRAAAPDLPATDVLTTDVLVVGAGPTGLMAGLVLARRGVRALVIDPKPEPTRESRAIVVQSRSMEIFDQLGLADAVLDSAQLTLQLQIRGGQSPVGADFFAQQLERHSSAR